MSKHLLAACRRTIITREGWFIWTCTLRVVRHTCFGEGHGFTACGKTRILGGAALQRCDKRSQMNKGFDAGDCKHEFFRSLFSRAVRANNDAALAPEGALAATGH